MHMSLLKAPAEQLDCNLTKLPYEELCNFINC